MLDAKSEHSHDAGAPLPPTSLIIGSRNREAMLAEAVRSVLHGSDIPSEIVVVDQSDRPSTQLDAFTGNSRCAVRYIWSDTRGISAARNLGISHARHDLLVFTDDDMLAPREWFGVIARALVRYGPNVVITGRVVATTPEHSGAFAPSVTADDHSMTYHGRIAADVLFSGNMAIHRSVLERTGGFDPRLGPGTPFPAAEDNDLGFRLLEQGYTIQYEPEALLYHRAWRARRDHVTLRWGYGVGQGAFYAKHLSVTDPFMIRRMLSHVERTLARMLRSHMRHRRRTYADGAFLGALVYGAVRWLLTRKLDQT